MVCLTPPLLNVPTGEWFCSNCKGEDVVSRSGRKVIKKFPRNNVDEVKATSKKRKKRGSGRSPKQKTIVLVEGGGASTRERLDSAAGQFDSDSVDLTVDALMSGTNATSPNLKSPGSNVDRSRKPGGRECLHLLRRSDGNPMGSSQITQIWDYASRGKGEQLRILKDAVDALHDGIVDFFAKPGKDEASPPAPLHPHAPAAAQPFNPPVILFSQIPAVAEPPKTWSNSAPAVSTLAAVAPAASLPPVLMKEEEQAAPIHRTRTTSVAGVGADSGGGVGYAAMATTNPSRKRKSHDGAAVPAAAGTFAPGGVLGSLSPESRRSLAGANQNQDQMELDNKSQYQALMAMGLMGSSTEGYHHQQQQQQLPWPGAQAQGQRQGQGQRESSASPQPISQLQPHPNSGNPPSFLNPPQSDKK